MAVKSGSTTGCENLLKFFRWLSVGFSVLDNHLHVLMRLDPEVATGWSDEEVVRRWGRLFPPRDQSRQPLPVSNDSVKWRLKDEGWVAKARARLQSLSWFMKCLVALAVSDGGPAPGWIRRGKARSKGFHSVATCSWSITPAGYSARARR